MTPDRFEPTPLCLSDDVLAAVVDGSLEEDRHSETLSHLAECDRCTGLVASLARVMDDPSVAQEIRRFEPTRRRWVYAVIPAVAAAALLLWITPVADDSDRHRAPEPVAGDRPVPVEPDGIVAQAAAFRWRSVPTAQQYRFTLFNDRGDVVFETQVPETSVVLPRTVTLVPGRPYLWKVEARVGYDRFQPSGLVEFSIARRPQR